MISFHVSNYYSIRRRRRRQRSWCMNVYFGCGFSRDPLSEMMHETFPASLGKKEEEKKENCYRFSCCKKWKNVGAIEQLFLKERKEKRRVVADVMLLMMTNQ